MWCFLSKVDSQEGMLYRKFVSIIVLMSFISCTVGCTSMRYVSREELSMVEQKSSVWVIMMDGTKIEVKDPKIEDSRLAGYVEPEGYKEIHFSEIESVGIREQDVSKTVKMAVIGVTGAIIVLWILSDSDSEEPPCST